MSTAVYMLASRHVAELAALASEVEPTEADGIAAAWQRQGAHAFVAERSAAAASGVCRSFAIEDAGRVVGLCELRAIDIHGAELDVWVAPRWRRRGHGAQAVRLMLELAFQNLRLPRVYVATAAAAGAGTGAAERLLAPHGFERAAERFVLARERWLAARHGPALARLSPALRALLDAELRAGNEIVEASTGWPEPESVLVRLRRPFLARPAALPAGVGYAERGDPHWWQLEYATERPRQAIVH